LSVVVVMSSLPLLSEDQFSCSICLDIFNNPVSTPCGHSYCQLYQCPLCKESFNRRPELHINRTLKEITEHFKQAAASGPPALEGRSGEDQSPKPRRRSTLSKRTEMAEGVINEMVHRFQKTSTDAHHDEPPPPYTPSRSAMDLDSSLPLCPVHLRGLAYFCRDENVCVCSLCIETGHLGHKVSSAKREWQAKKSQLGILDAELKNQICERERKVHEIQTLMISQSSTLLSAQRLLKELEEELSELKKKSASVNQLALTDDYSFASVSAPPQTKDWSGASVASELPSGVVLRNITQTIERFKDEMCKLTEVCKSNQSFQRQGMFSCTGVLQQPYCGLYLPVSAPEDITMDPNTAHPRLIISADGKQVFCGERHQPVPDSSERFDRVVCVLAREGFDSGRHYWEVEVGGKTDWDLGVASHSVCRKGKITVSPAHGYWFLSLRDNTDYAFRTEPSTSLTVSTRPSKIGIYVDYDKGIVSFYNVDAKVLIYTFTDRFPDVILPFFSPCTNKSGRNEEPLIICPVSTIE
uniref:Bloodthirsty-related gene family, member 1 n=1 Tax=Neogobius melanostomus TaxID=47308 RepID=A0A8C6SBT8_9GOBI